MKHSFYPTDALEARLREDAKLSRRSIGKVVCDILDAYYAQFDEPTEPKPEAPKAEMPKTETPKSETPRPETAKAEEMNKGVCELLLDAGLNYSDNRPKGGCLWVLDQQGARERLLSIQKQLNCKFVWVADGSRATNGKAAWYMVKG